jgi:hypothetical protein
MSHMIKCDRCTVTIEHNALEFREGWAALTDLNNNSVASNEEALHLCVGCTKAFDSFMEPPEDDA